MTSRDYRKLAIEEFGAHLIQSKDLDPVYVALHNLHSCGHFDIRQLSRWLLSYLLCYHCGAACWFSEQEGDQFFSALFTAAENKLESPVGGRWPRSHERRHWRGEFATKVVAELAGRYEGQPENFILTIAGVESFDAAKPQPISFQEFSKRVQSHHGFGGWATFKLADLIDRLGLAPVNFAYEDVVIYKDPVEAAKRLFRERYPVPEGAEVKDAAVKDVFNYLIKHFEDEAAPPLYDRPIGLQEVETVLCKYKSHLNGRYPLYNDTIEIHEGLAPWLKNSKAAQLFSSAMPSQPTKDQEYTKSVA